MTGAARHEAGLLSADHADPLRHFGGARADMSKGTSVWTCKSWALVGFLRINQS